jgi:hypothetical protein
MDVPGGLSWRVNAPDVNFGYGASGT